MGIVFHRPAARRDLTDHYIYLAQHAGEAIAERFLHEAEASCEVLVTHPLIGAPVSSNHPALSGVRKWRVSSFSNHLIFYIPVAKGVSVIRVLHATQDWWSLLGVTEPPLN